ncbi:hypothetical protein [Acidiplasma aeolicum]|jgi:hypothetical protein|uniref:hypothetical protein n=1 Tax=Acidiplasma aeolicum TaxID=507754 RepID=UPI00371B2087
MAKKIRDYKSWVTSHTECPNCHYRFNFRHSKWGSVSAVRVGSNWVFICPNCKTKQSFLLKKGEEEGLPLIIDMPLSSFLSEAFAGLVALVIVTIVLYYVASKNISSDVFIYGFAISIIAYIVYMIWLGFISRSSGRTYIMDQHH